ncbi:DUF2934 domain-containing protein [Xanthomonas phaseoli]|uniref:DUF2934 domain-containing protein n=1 Tax=Xanthomonas manihotis TaxID=43353 RepID=A0A8I1XLF1_XANMN|nr:DUF2934 domain-containing protein [Xanthomonas phaseoli]RWU19428.1 DUF2934 domain-containing protein [Xanthomonas phaseoli pv. manihotis str. CIO151]KUF25165.1 hypothetical protein AO826_09375 [Xanthomonas phaseoli pv. manihotis]MBO9719547.1 DUF2934 domain-containing protein [Xanthomonas phaseoli pv. manihotis]MBO9761314.1 DUF2934 domain-containing protein [Xanthomonas phaseoli pv. manihotis]MBO9782517.1 DUF2934 domain-containing protein [Xanthomonas phaseoli pv. manihotis]
MNDMERQARLAQLAREIWEAEGRPDGHAGRHWAMAERLVEAEERAAEQAAEYAATPIAARQ